MRALRSLPPLLLASARVGLIPPARIYGPLDLLSGVGLKERNGNWRIVTAQDRSANTQQGWTISD